MSAIVGVEEFTRVMREADQAFVKSGGSTRHFVRDVLFPLMEREGITIVRAAYSANELRVMNAGAALLAALKPTIPTLREEVERTREAVANWPEAVDGPPTLAMDEKILADARDAIILAEGES